MSDEGVKASQGIWRRRNSCSWGHKNRKESCVGGYHGPWELTWRGGSSGMLALTLNWMKHLLKGQPHRFPASCCLRGYTTWVERACRLSSNCPVTMWSLRVQSLGLFKVAVQLGSQWKPNGRVCSCSVVTVRSLCLWSLGLVEMVKLPGSQQQQRGRVGSICVVSTRSLHVRSTRLLKVAVLFAPS